MTRFKFALLACALAAVTLSPSVDAASQRRILDFRLVNGTRSTIMELYVSPTRDGKWGEDVLGRDILRPGERLDLQFSRSEPTCNWDLKIIDQDKGAVQWERFNLCEASEITLKYDNRKPTAIVR